MFPGYVFAHFDYAPQHRQVAATRGVAKILKFGGIPSIVPDAIIEELRSAVDDGETVEIDSTIEAGDEVQLVAGPFQGIRAVVSRVLPEQKRVAILMELLGMEREVDVPYDDVLPDVIHPMTPRS